MPDVDLLQKDREPQDPKEHVAQGQGAGGVGPQDSIKPDTVVPQSPQPLSRAFSKFYARVRNLLSWPTITPRGWSALAVFFIFTLWSGFYELFMLSTGGSVYIDSPQVYTRERLVNDRFREQAWLNGKLRELDKDQGVISAQYLEKTLVSTIASLSNEAEKGGLSVDQLKGRLEDLSKALTIDLKNTNFPSPLFSDNFEKQQRYRDIVRRAMIENELDDRHDLGSNSLFLFKFGAAIAPENRTSSRLRIEMNLKPDPLPSLTGLINEIGHPCDGLYEFECGYVSRNYLTDKERDYVRTDGNKKTVIETRSPRSYGNDLDQWNEFFFRWLEQEKLKTEQVKRNNKAALDSQSHYDDVSRRAAVQIAEIERRLKKFRSVLAKRLPQLINDKAAALTLPIVGTPPAESRSLSAELEIRLTKHIEEIFVPNFSVGVGGLEPLLETYSLAAQKEYLRNRPDLLLGGFFLDVAQSALQCSPNPEASPLNVVQNLVGQTTEKRSQFEVSLDKDVISAEIVRNCLLNSVFPVDGDNIEEPSKFSIFYEPNSDIKNWPPDGWSNVFSAVSVYSSDALKLSSYRTRSVSGLSPTVQQIDLTALKFLTQDGQEARLFINRIRSGALDPGSRLLDVIVKDADRKKLWKQDSDYRADGVISSSQTGATVPTGLFLFIQRMSKAQQSHSYSVTPRAEFDLISDTRGNSWDASLNPSGDGILGWFTGSFTRVTAQSQVKRQNRIVGYASESGAPDANTTATFGWVVLPKTEDGWLFSRSRIVPANEDLSALVSLPAWWDRVSIEVSSDWMDDWANRLDIEPSPGPFNVELPIRLDLINKLLTDQENQAPVVDTAGFWTIDVFACSKADIVIPGQNLWRSTVVTLGGQKADLIEVLPDMSGIIAGFSKIEIPLAKLVQDGKVDPNKSTPLDLIVWTSEGHYVLTDHISVKLPLDINLDQAKLAGKCPVEKPVPG